MLLRMEDIDLQRCSEAFEAAIADDLSWLGVTWDGPVWRQSDRFDAYEAAYGHLLGRGLLYPCFCTRGAIASALAGRPDWPRDPDGSPLYPGTCRRYEPGERARRMAAGRPFCLRLDMNAALAAASGTRLGWTEHRERAVPVPVEAHPEIWGDVVLRRKDIPASYHMAVVVDDAAQAVTDVVRGEDLFAATGLHRLLQNLLGLPEPAYHHHTLVRDPHGEKLSKSHKARPLAEYRKDGATPEDIVGLLDLH